MKTKKIFLLFIISAFSILLAACAKTTANSGNANGYITASLLSLDELGEGFNADYLPDTSSIKKLSGKIDVCLDFEGNQYGWKAVAEEYERLHDGAVTVVINDNLSGSTYSEKLNQELQNSNTDWDICEGNLGYSNTHASCINVSSLSNTINAYCGKNVIWSSVVDETAFEAIESHTTDTYIINSETMQSAWFINDVAFDAAVEQGYLNSEGKAEYPVTWDDLINLCTCMEAAGYDHPLGITLSASSVQSLQFTWLLRIYGDYYFRQFYPYIQSADFWDGYDPTATDVETYAGYGYKYCKILNILLDEETTNGPGYVGYKSEVYKDFVSNLAKMKGHLIANVDSTEFSALRDQFRTQSLGKSSAQIVLDYLGNGLTYQSSDVEGTYEVGYFDYPTMVSGYYQSGEKEGQQIVDPETITRDIGGNGGFISIVKHLGDSAQNELNIDFVKFFLSPYGQTIYYKGLAENGIAPKGLSTVDNNLVVIPSEWKEFFAEANKTITFNGNVDGNPFISFGVRYFGGLSNTESCIVSNWRALLMTGVGSGALKVNSFCNKWADACYKDYEKLCATNNWNTNMYLNFYGTN